MKSLKIKACIGNEIVIGPLDEKVDIPRINSNILYSDSKNKLGRVSDIIGKADAPYVVVKVSHKFKKENIKEIHNISW